MAASYAAHKDTHKTGTHVRSRRLVETPLLPENYAEVAEAKRVRWPQSVCGMVLRGGSVQVLLRLVNRSEVVCGVIVAGPQLQGLHVCVRSFT